MLLESYRRLADVFHEVLSEHQPEALLDRIADTVAGVVPYDALHIYQADEERRELVPVLARSDYEDEILRSRPSTARGSPGGRFCTAGPSGRTPLSSTRGRRPVPGRRSSRRR